MKKETYNWSAPKQPDLKSSAAPAGSHASRIVSIVDIGTHEIVSPDGNKQVRQIRITLELPNEKHAFKDGEDPKPYVVSQKFTLSFHPKANLRKMMDSWTGRKISDKEVYSGEWKLPDLLGTAGMVNVVHAEAKDGSGKVYANVAGYSPLPKGLDCPPQVNPSSWFFMGNAPGPYTVDDMAIVALPQFVKEMIMESPEWKAATGSGLDPEDLPFDAK